MYKDRIPGADFLSELADSFEKRLALDISDSAADFNDRYAFLITFFRLVKTALYLICNVRNDLYRSSAEIPVAFLLEYASVYLTGCDV